MFLRRVGRSFLAATWQATTFTTIPSKPVSIQRIRTMAYSMVERGTLHELDYRLFFKGPAGIISPFHDIPLYANTEKNVFNMVVEVPRWSNAKMEINTKERMNPIKQDEKKGKPRFVNNCFPHHGYIWNYGALPQTWENPEHVDESTNCKGDNDPLDVCEIGHIIHPRGAVVKVKPLGVIALIDEGETDWKIMAIDVTDPLADKLNDICDIETHMPGFLDSTREWFKIYKVPTGKPFNEFAFCGQFKDRCFAMGVIQATHKQWENLVGQMVENNGLCCDNVTIPGSPYYIDHDDANTCVDMSAPLSDPKPIPDEVNLWHYISQK